MGRWCRRGASYRVGLATTRSRQHRCRGALRRSLSPTFRLEFLSLRAGVPTDPARRSFCSTCSGRLMARSPPGADVDFFLAISVCCGDRAGWGDGAGAARATGSDWRRPDRDSTAVGGLFGVLSLRHFGWSFYPFARGYRRIRRGEAIKGNKAIARQSPLLDLSLRRALFQRTSTRQQLDYAEIL